MFNLKNSGKTKIGKGTIINGSIQSKEDIQIEGEVKGDVISEKSIALMEKGAVRRDIMAKDCLLKGEVDGDISVEDEIEVTSSAKIEGNIRAKILIAEEGFIFSYVNHESQNGKLIADVEKF